jgi:hypothetical protein
MPQVAAHWFAGCCFNRCSLLLLRCIMLLQVLRKRREQHKARHGPWLHMWYVQLGSHQDRRALQGFLTKALDTAGFDMGSRHDAHYARKK